MKKMKCLLFIGITVFVFVSGEALQCYQSLGIDNPFNGKDLQIICSKPSNVCIRSSQCLSNGSNIDFRGCIEFPSYNNSEYNNLVEKLPENVRLSGRYASHHCDSNYCNGAHQMFEDLNFCNSKFDVTIRSTVLNHMVRGSAESIIAMFTTILTSLLMSIYVSY